MSIVIKAALPQHTDIRDPDVMEEWPPQPSQLTVESANLPAVVKHFLHMIITGHEEVSNQIISVERQITSIGQDIIDAVLEGRRHPPKHLTAS